MPQKCRATNSCTVAFPPPIRDARLYSATYLRCHGGKPKEVVFAEILTGFLLAGADPKLVAPSPHVVALNLVMAEDWYVPMRDFALHMRMLNYFHERYPQVHIALHAGELVEGLVPPKVPDSTFPPWMPPRRSAPAMCARKFQASPK